MSKCSNPARCDGYQWLCGRCRRAFPTLARQYDARKQEQRESRRNRNNSRGNRRSTESNSAVDAGYGQIGNDSMYYDTNPDGSTNIFPDGQPRGQHTDFPHDKMIVEKDGEVTYYREDGEPTMDSRNYRR